MQKNENLVEVKRVELENIILRFVEKNLTEEYNTLCKKVLDEVVRVYGEAILKGKGESWAAGIVHAIATENKLLSSKGELKASKIYEEIGISSSAALGKSKDIRNTLNSEILILNEVLEEVAATVVEDSEPIAKVNKLKEAIKDTQYLLAQDIMRMAWDSKNFKMKMKYAKEAIEISPNCSDAYIILSKDNSLNDCDKEEVISKAVQASLRVLNLNSAEEIVMDEWKREDLTPFFAAQYKLAVHQWQSGKRQEGLKNLLVILNMDKEDKLMVRSILSNWLIIEKETEVLDEMLQKYRTDYLTAIHYTDALNKYVKGDKEEADRAIRKAYRRNPHVLDYITKKKRVSMPLPAIKQYGSNEEAMHYMKDGVLAWQSVEGAVDWIKEFKKNIV
ncbi:MAG: DUF6398 domain-containing protein [Clostridium sp.]